MSNYFRTLLRLENERREPAPMERSAQSPELEAVRLEASQAPGDLTPGFDLLSAKKQNSHAALLDALRAVSARGQTPSIVIAGVASSEPVGAVIEGIATQAAARGVGVQIGDVVVSSSHRILSTREGTPEPRGLDGPPAVSPGMTTLSLELSAPATQEALRKWFASAGAGYDLLIVAAPSLLSSVDAALVARACDG
ncbi:MAG: hypothetical protein AAF657_13660, partial [Acidobacteriota bacterium]